MERAAPWLARDTPITERFVPPESLPTPTESVHWTTEKAPPIWADLTYLGGAVQGGVGTVFVDEDFTDGKARNWTLTGSASLRAKAWQYA